MCIRDRKVAVIVLLALSSFIVNTGYSALKSAVQVPAILLDAVILKVVASAGILFTVSLIKAAICLKERALKLPASVTFAYIGPLLEPAYFSRVAGKVIVNALLVTLISD